jgi:DNA-binding GntR family transcriptional regulator
MRQTLAMLGDEGYITRTAGRGTIVLATSPKRRVEQWSTLKDLLALNKGTSQQILSIEEVERLSDFAEREAGPKAPDRWLRVSVLRSQAADGAPFSMADIYVAHQYSGVIRKRCVVGKAGVFNQPFYELVRRTYGVIAATVDQSITAVPATVLVAEALGIKRGSSSLRVVRSYRDASGTCIEVAVSHYPGQTFSYRTTMSIESDSDSPVHKP